MIKPVELESEDGRDTWDTIVATSAGDVASRRISPRSIALRASLKFACAERAWLTAISGPS